MPVLDLAYQHTPDDLIPFIKDGILIDTSVMILFIDGFISVRYSKKSNEDYDCLLNFFNLIKVNNKWDKFRITPQILTEVCNHFKNIYNKTPNFKDLANDIIPILAEMKDDKEITKKDIISKIDFGLTSPIIEIGDISIFLVADSISNKKEKTSILVKDWRFNEEYKDNSNVMVMDYNNILLNLR